MGNILSGSSGFCWHALNKRGVELAAVGDGRLIEDLRCKISEILFSLHRFVQPSSDCCSLINIF